ncbi:hypothetical protein [Streptococcus catagoni]|uniref:hypothetical protein n=1 Tax=Streptococcus catagoni TaxID=2654874 RepID=UPI00140B25BD|nr:hypothetical protein [Streptococcus catagoni]
MSIEKRKLLAEHLSKDSRQIFQLMVPEIQDSYVHYIYSADKEITQLKRRKQLDKSLRKLMTEVYYYLMPLSQDSVKEILTTWKLIDFDKEDLQGFKGSPKTASEEKDYCQVLRNGQLIGYCIFQVEGEQLRIRFARKETDASKNGEAFFTAIENFALSRYEIKSLEMLVDEKEEAALKTLEALAYKSFKVSGHGQESSYLKCVKVIS